MAMLNRPLFVVYCCIFFGYISCQVPPGPQALIDYVYTDDGYFEWNVEEIIPYPEEGVTTYHINMTSQHWFNYNSSVVSRPVWYHNIYIHVPDVFTYTDAAYLHISSRSNGGWWSTTRTHVVRTREYAAAVGMLTAVIEQVPNQPMTFYDQTRERTEDDIISFTWRTYMDWLRYDGKDEPQFLLRFPMVKSAIKGYDTIAEFANQQFGYTVDKFIVAGESKRGHTTWMTTIDPRTVAMIPQVLSNLNMIVSFSHYWQSFKGWPIALFDYWNSQIMGEILTPEFAKLCEYVDPFSYRSLMTEPILEIYGASDEFFLNDDSHYFWNWYNDEQQFDGIPDPKWMWLQEDTSHGVNDGPNAAAMWRAFQAFGIAVLDGLTLPTFTESRDVDDAGGWIMVFIPTPFRAQLRNIESWSAESVVPHRRDWRQFTTSDTDIKWAMKPVETMTEGYYRAYYRFPQPEEGFLSHFIKMTFEVIGAGGRNFTMTSESQILPTWFPYIECDAAMLPNRNISGCQGVLK